MEKSENVWILPAGFGWADIGNWESLYEYLAQHDSFGNASDIDGKSLLREGRDNIIYSDGKGKLIAIRPHTRFIAFPEHTHDYVEMIYMCVGETRHTVNGNAVAEDDLLTVCVVERGCDLPAGFNGLAKRDSAIGKLPAPLRKRHSGCVAHDHHAVAGEEAQFAARLVVSD